MVNDPHSCWRAGEPRIRHVDFDLNLDFPAHTIHGFAVYRFDGPLGDGLRLDTRDVTIRKVGRTGGDPRPCVWSLLPAKFGQILEISGLRGATELRIEFATSPDATALQWLDPAQTAGQKHPYVYSQCQALHARSIFPCQDSPAVRFTYGAKLRLPTGLRAVMAATPGSSYVDGGQSVHHFRMDHPIPSYLFALAAGNIVSREIGPRSLVYAEPEVVDAAAWEFADVERMIVRATELFGDYRWGRFDLLVLPPSFPYGGMENPTLTFLTPTLIAGDRSLVAVVAHELAHSWTGNLVTNATWEDFWLNEGWTVYAERRITEELYGRELAYLQAVNGRNSLMRSFRDLGQTSPHTRLKTDLKDVDPDEVYSSVPYEKGYLLMVAMERLAGRPVFDRFIRTYISDFGFSSLTTGQFVEYLRRQLPGVADRVHLDNWLYQPGLPADAPMFQSALMDDVRRVRALWDGGERHIERAVLSWCVQQKVLFLEELPPKQSGMDCAHLERIFEIDTSRNTEVILPYLCVAAASAYAPAFPKIRDVVSRVGRGKYLKPLYRALNDNEDTRPQAHDLFNQFKDRYHSVARAAIQRILAA